jgi:hypothetical protein
VVERREGNNPRDRLLHRWEENSVRITRNDFEYVDYAFIFGYALLAVLLITVMNLLLNLLSDCEFSGTLLNGVSFKPKIM